jgi:hypothetical protein
LYFTFEPSQSAFQRLAILQMDFCQLKIHHLPETTSIACRWCVRCRNFPRTLYDTNGSGPIVIFQNSCYRQFEGSDGGTARPFGDKLKINFDLQFCSSQADNYYQHGEKD